MLDIRSLWAAGLPIGLQIVAPAWQESRLLYLASVLERHLDASVGIPQVMHHDQHHDAYLVKLWCRVLMGCIYAVLQFRTVFVSCTLYVPKP